MNYKRLYNALIQKRRIHKVSRVRDYCENHHIIPKCRGGSNRKYNLVLLKASEHFIAHLLLIKIYPEDKNLLYAALKMSTCKKYINNKKYDQLKRICYKNLKIVGPLNQVLVNNGIIQCFTFEKDLESYLLKGFKRGRLKRICPWCKHKVDISSSWHWGNCLMKPGNELKSFKYPEEKRKCVAEKIKKKALIRREKGIVHANKGRKKTDIKECEFCRKLITTSNYRQFHGVNCLKKPGNSDIKRSTGPHKKIKCDYCSIEANIGNYTKLHGENCRKKPGNEGRKHYSSEETRLKQSIGGKNRKKIMCPFCKKEFDPGNYSRSHGNNCRLNPENENNVVVHLKPTKKLKCELCSREVDLRNFGRHKIKCEREFKGEQK